MATRGKPGVQPEGGDAAEEALGAPAATCRAGREEGGSGRPGGGAGGGWWRLAERGDSGAGERRDKLRSLPGTSLALGQGFTLPRTRHSPGANGKTT